MLSAVVGVGAFLYGKGVFNMKDDESFMDKNPQVKEFIEQTKAIMEKILPTAFSAVTTYMVTKHIIDGEEEQAFEDEDKENKEDEEYEENSKFEYITVDEDSLNNGKVILIDEQIEGFKEIKTVYNIPTIFVNMDTYNKIEENLKNENEENMSVGNTEAIKIKCDNVIEFANYIQDISIKKNCPIIVEYYTLENKEKIIYISVLENILNTIMTSIIVLGIVSTVNIINSSLCERKYDFKILYSLGATKENINKMLINEGIYIFIKALIISILLSIPILYVIIKYMENVVIINKLLVPYQNICIFIVVLFLLSFIITIFSTKFIEEE